MVNSEALLRQIIGIDSLLAMNGIIPSISLYRSKMRQLIISLHSVLCIDHPVNDHVIKFCSLLCRLIDDRIKTMLIRNRQMQNGETLENELYGPILDISPLTERLRELLNTSHGQIFTLSKMLAAYFPVLEPQNAEMLELAVTWAEQYIQESPPYQGAPSPSHTLAPRTTRFSVAALMSFCAPLIGLLLLWFLLKKY